MPQNASLYLWIKWCLLKPKDISPPLNIKKPVSTVHHLFLYCAVNVKPLKCFVSVFNAVALALVVAFFMLVNWASEWQTLVEVCQLFQQMELCWKKRQNQSKLFAICAPVWHYFSQELVLRLSDNWKQSGLVETVSSSFQRSSNPFRWLIQKLIMLKTSQIHFMLLFVTRQWICVFPSSNGIQIWGHLICFGSASVSSISVLATLLSSLDCLRAEFFRTALPTQADRPCSHPPI